MAVLSIVIKGKIRLRKSFCEVFLTQSLQSGTEMRILFTIYKFIAGKGVGGTWLDKSSIKK
ncbi:hypothetical protein GCM10011332_12950 [Terasakiella brassicae]|uniref:Uncharacterized protein n=1 Tax=Terasakiella brassicae TaxID=1634917 RepID=A0A917F8S7_9PROT|nr:hypothetical protein GCM10011332_12950 [Terasakiella brassicae]